MSFEYVFIGAGPSNLAAVNALLDNGVTKLIVLEKGGPLEKRGCPSIRIPSCTRCNGDLCHVDSGEGGSSALFGNKLCYFPASNGIRSYLPPADIISAGRYLDKLIGPTFQSWLNAPEELLDLSRPLVRKEYISTILPRQDFQQLIRNLLKEPRMLGKIRLRKEVIDIRRLGSDKFAVVTSDGDLLETKRIVLGSGRSSHSFLRRLFTELGIPFGVCQPDIGIRLEARPQAFTKAYSYQADPKYKVVRERNGSSRTFCACNGGMIVPIKLGNAYYADGAFGAQLSDWNNLALMVRPNLELDPDGLERWCKKINDLRNGLLLGEVLLTDDTPTVVSSIMSLIPAWPTPEHRAMMTDFLFLTLGGRDRLLAASADGATVRIYGPALDFYWPRPKIEIGLKTNMSGLFTLGDATGISRGFVQGMISGVAWALAQIGESVAASEQVFDEARLDQAVQL